MALIINIVAAIILFWYPIKLYMLDGENKIKAHPLDKGVSIYVNKDLDFLVYCVMTAMVFLGPLSLVKYGFWIIVLLFLLISRFKIRWNAIIVSYCIFIGWAAISTIFFSTQRFQASMLLIKYTMPLLYLWLAYTAINDKEDLLYFMKMSVVAMCFYALIIGGFTERVFPWVYRFFGSQLGGLLTTYAPLADFYSSLIVVPVGLYIITKDKKWLWAAFWIALSTLCAVVRTGLGGITLALSFLLFTVYKGRSIPWIAGVGVAAVLIVFTVPAFREKMFKDDSVTLSTFDSSQMNFEKIESSQREYTWERAMSRFYEGHESYGSGLGETMTYMKNVHHIDLHSDYVQILCDLGQLGIVLFAVFVIVTILTIIHTAWLPECPPYLVLTGGMALGSCAGTFFSMAYDNVMMYSQQSYVLPFVMIGIYMKVRDLYISGQWQD